MVISKNYPCQEANRMPQIFTSSQTSILCTSVEQQKGQFTQSHWLNPRYNLHDLTLMAHSKCRKSSVLLS